MTKLRLLLLYQRQLRQRRRRLRFRRLRPLSCRHQRLRLRYRRRQSRHHRPPCHRRRYRHRRLLCPLLWSLRHRSLWLRPRQQGRLTPRHQNRRRLLNPRPRTRRFPRHRLCLPQPLFRRLCQRLLQMPLERPCSWMSSRRFQRRARRLLTSMGPRL